MPDLNLHKFDQRGQLVKQWVPLITGVANELPGDITTDKESLWITRYDAIAANAQLIQITKRGTIRKSHALADSGSRGVTTDRSALAISTSTGIYTLNKTNTQVRAKVGANYEWLSESASDLFGCVSGTNQIAVMDPRTGTIRYTFGTSAIPVGVTATETHIVTIEAAYLMYYDMRGVLRKSYALPNPTAYRYVGVVDDDSYLWILSSPITDIDPPKDE